MNSLKLLLCLFLGLNLQVACSAQEAFSNCTAAFLDNKMVVDEYTPDGKCSLPQTATGVLSVCTADLSPTNGFPVAKIKFMVALRDQNTRTLTMFSKETYKELDIQKVLARCKKGDHIVLLTLDDEYAFPHNEILIK